MAKIIKKKRKKAKKYLKIIIPKNMEIGVFSNIAQISSTDEIIIIDFAFVLPNSRKGNLVSKVIITKEHAKDLKRILSNNLK